MKLENYGALFLKMKDGKVLYVLYIKTNFMAKTKAFKHHTITYFDKPSKAFKTKPHQPNKIWGIVFDNGVDYVMNEDMSYAEFTAMIEDAKEVYNAKHYTPETMYDTMKVSGLKKLYTKKWFDDAHTFITKQLESL